MASFSVWPWRHEQRGGVRRSLSLPAAQDLCVRRHRASLHERRHMDTVHERRHMDTNSRLAVGGLSRQEPAHEAREARAN
jgi:hypothetical protein